MTNLKIFIPKNETGGDNEAVLKLDEPIKLYNCLKMFVNSISIFWDYNNLDSNIHTYTYDTGGANTKIGFKDGYYTFNILKTEFEKTGSIEIKQLDFSGKCTIKTDKTINLQTIGPILGFPLNKVISPNTLTESDNVVNINNNLEYINITCNMIDKSKNFVNGKRSNVLIQVPITTQQTLKGSVFKIYFPSESTEVTLSNGIYNEIKFKVKGNNDSAIGDVLLEIKIK